MNVPLLVSSLIIAGSEKTVKFINFEFISKGQHMFPWISYYFKLE